MTILNLGSQSYYTMAKYSFFFFFLLMILEEIISAGNASHSIYFIWINQVL